MKRIEEKAEEIRYTKVGWEWHAAYIFFTMINFCGELAEDEKYKKLYTDLITYLDEKSSPSGKEDIDDVFLVYVQKEKKS